MLTADEPGTTVVGQKNEDTFWRKALGHELKLTINLRFLATRDSYTSLIYRFSITHNAICSFIDPVCAAIIAKYAEELIKCSVIADEWKKVADGFAAKWNLPHFVGAIDD